MLFIVDFEKNPDYLDYLILKPAIKTIGNPSKTIGNPIIIIIIMIIIMMMIIIRIKIIIIIYMSARLQGCCHADIEHDPFGPCWGIISHLPRCDGFCNLLRNMCTRVGARMFKYLRHHARSQFAEIRSCS